MGKTSKKEERRNALKCLDEPPTNRMRDDVRKALAQYCHEEDVDVRKRGKPDVRLKDLLPIMRSYHSGWDYIRVEDLNTNKYRCIKLLNDAMHKLLSDKNKLAAMIRDLESDSQGSDDGGSSPNESLKGDDAMADACGERDKHKKEQKSKAGRSPPEQAQSKAKTKTDTPKKEQQYEEAGELGACAGAHCSSAADGSSSESNRVSAPASADQDESKAGKPTPEHSASSQQRGLPITEENPLVLNNVSVGRLLLRHG